MDESLLIKRYSDLTEVEDTENLDVVAVNTNGRLVKIPTSLFATGNVKPLIIQYANNIEPSPVSNDNGVM